MATFDLLYSLLIDLCHLVRTCIRSAIAQLTEDYSDDGCSYLGRKPSGSQVLLQKRSESTEIHGDQGGLEGDEDYGGSDPGAGSSDESDYVGSNLYEDDDDRGKPVQMTELQKNGCYAIDRATEMMRTLRKTS
ncbi:hypothetical protein CDL15_Pgr000195 [Punica granatum]|uniref:Uncharacterized protein n=1 Tax=Punica granatum TaxID=22663 RepID=A0A218Y344_PUNGR|nr:hypothetical protein CDL15_Pgr000195 [Punica granatum]